MQIQSTSRTDQRKGQLLFRKVDEHISTAAQKWFSPTIVYVLQEFAQKCFGPSQIATEVTTARKVL